MGIALRRGFVSVDRRIAATPAEVWRVLIDVREWPLWGPSVRRAELQGGGSEISEGARGTVWTAAGVALPFVITDFASGHRWEWSVAGVPATGHEVTAVAGGCRVRFAVPWWAPGYLTVCAVALRRIERLVAS